MVPSTSFSSVEIEKLNYKWNACCSDLTPPPVEEIAFMMETRLLYTIDSYSKSIPDGKEAHAIQVKNGKHWVKIEGEFQPIAEIMKTMSYDQKKGKILSQDPPQVVWSYGANGLCKHDRFRYEKLPVCLTISKEEQNQLLEQGKKFWQKEISSLEDHTCLLQLITTQHVVSKSPLWSNWSKGYPQHVTFRLIDEAGNVYSFGFERENDVITAVKTDGYVRGFFTSSRVCVASPDYEETYRSNSKLSTTISISSDSLQKIKTLVETENKEGITFNFLGGNLDEHANCMTYAQHILKTAGVKEIPERRNPYFFLLTLLPNIEHLPYVGKSLSNIAEKVSSIVNYFFKAYRTYVPTPIQSIVKSLVDTVLFIPKKMGSIVANCIFAYAGGMKKGPEAKKALLENWEDFLTDRVLDSHIALIRWQERQSSTKKIDTSGCVKFYF